MAERRRRVLPISEVVALRMSRRISTLARYRWPFVPRVEATLLAFGVWATASEGTGSRGKNSWVPSLVGAPPGESRLPLTPEWLFDSVWASRRASRRKRSVPRISRPGETSRDRTRRRLLPSAGMGGAVLRGRTLPNRFPPRTLLERERPFAGLERGGPCMAGAIYCAYIDTSSLNLYFL